MKSTVSLEMREFVVGLPTSSVLAPVRLAPAATVTGGGGWRGGGGGGGRGVGEADDKATGGLPTARGGGRGVRDHRGSRLHLPLRVVVDQRDLAW